MATDRQKTKATGDNATEYVADEPIGGKTRGQEVQRVADTLPEEILKSSTWDEETLRGVTDFESAVALVEQEFGPLVSADQELGDGFTLLGSEDKGRLTALQMLVMEWTFNDGDFGKFVSMRVMVKEKSGAVSRYILNDGSTGICEQLAKYTKRTGRTGGLVVKNGLRESTYTYVDEKTGEERPAKTYYLDTSA